MLLRCDVGIPTGPDIWLKPSRHQLSREATDLMYKLICTAVAWTVPVNVLLCIIKHDQSAEAEQMRAHVKPSWLPPKWLGHN